MTLQLLHRKWWTIVCPPSCALCNGQKGCITGAVRGLLLELIYPQWYTRLYMVCLVSHGNRGLPDTVPRSEVLT